MRAERMWLFSDVLEKNRRVFKVPVYQRNYDWSNEECEKLFQDILNANERDCQHFTGTIVYIADVESGSGLDEVLIIDGQQRITTVYILLKALYNASKNISIRVESEIEDVMFNRLHGDINKGNEKYKVKLKPVKTDNEQLLLLIKDKLDDMDKNSNIYKNYVVFRNLIEETIENGYELNDILNGIKKLEVVEIKLDKTKGDEPQKIFESINSTGVALSLADLVRNYLLMDDIKQDELYENYWLEIEKNVGYENLGDFVINFLNYKISKSVNSKNAYQLFKEHCKNESISHEDILKDLKRTSKCYGAFIGKIKCYEKIIMDYLLAFNTIKQTTVLPFLFKIFDDYEYNKIDEKIICNVLEYLLTYFVRITACESNKNLAKFMKSLYGRVYDGDYDKYYEKLIIFLNDCKTNNRMPSDKEFKDALVYKPIYKKSICKYILSIIENSTNEHLDVDNLTIEHILPQKENAAVWKKELGDEYSHVYEVYLHTLGNLTITGNNSELGTKSFKDKKDIIKNNSKANILNKEVLSVDKWNEEAIINRAKKLSDFLTEKFKYINLHSDNTVLKGFDFNVNSGLDMSNSKPDSFEFMGEIVKVNNWTDLLSKFINLSYELDKSIFINLAKRDYSIPNASKTYISNDKNKIRSSKQITNSGIYYETNLSANSKISFIKDLLIQMNLDVDDFTFSLKEIPFNIYDENTWQEGVIPTAKLFYNLMDNLLQNGKIKSEEIEKLKTKEYTKKLFQSTDYTAVTDDRSDNMGNSTQKRYRKIPLIFKGEKIYISTQFFDADRYAIIEWYKSHL